MSESQTKHPSGEPQGDRVIASDIEAQLTREDSPAVDEQIRMRAYELYRERDGLVGDDMSDWLRAESEFRGRLRGTTGASHDGQGAAISAPPGNQA